MVFCILHTHSSKGALMLFVSVWYLIETRNIIQLSAAGNLHGIAFSIFAVGWALRTASCLEKSFNPCCWLIKHNLWVFCVILWNWNKLSSVKLICLFWCSIKQNRCRNVECEYCWQSADGLIVSAGVVRWWWMFPFVCWQIPVRVQVREALAGNQVCSW